jgi:hypothetical protein
VNRTPAKNPCLRLAPELYEDLRQQALRRDGWRCQSCGAMSNLEVHHKERPSQSRDDAELNLITLCVSCSLLHTYQLTNSRPSTKCRASSTVAGLSGRKQPSVLQGSGPISDLGSTRAAKSYRLPPQHRFSNAAQHFRKPFDPSCSAKVKETWSKEDRYFATAAAGQTFSPATARPRAGPHPSRFPAP